jgi:O-antigen/teichoic acid export membrane protein
MNIFHSIQKIIISRLNFDNDPHFKSVFRGSSITLVARLANAFTLLIINFIIAKEFGSEDVGVLAVVSSVLNVIIIFNVFGTSTAILRLVPEYKSKFSSGSAREVYKRTLITILSLAPIISGLIIIIGYYWIKHENPSDIRFSFVLILAALSPLFSLYKINTESIRAFFHNKLYSFALVLPALTNLILLIFFVVFFPDHRSPLWAFYGSNLLIAIGSSWMMKSILPAAVAGEIIEKIPYKTLLSISVPMGISMGISQIMGNLDNLILSYYRPETEVGIYSIAVKLSLLMSFVILSVNAAAASKFSQLNYSNRQPELMILVKKTNIFIVWFTIPIFLGLVVLGKPILFAFGPEFNEGYLALIILSIGGLVNAIGGSNALFMNMTGSHNQQQIIMIGALAVYILLNIVLIPQYGYIGSAWARLISTFGWNLAATTFIYQKTGHWISYLPDFLRKHGRVDAHS